MATIIIGLGNLGKKFERTRHNIGFLVLDKFREKNNFPDFKFSEKYNSLISEGIIEKTSSIFNGRDNKENKIILVKPQTFMNESGKVVKKIISNATLRGVRSAFSKFQMQPSGVPVDLENLIVVHDDIDLPVGKIKIIKERGSAGHKGVESIIKNIGNNGLVRVRIGIAPQSKIKAKQIVLKKFSEKEQKIINQVIEKSVQSLILSINEGIEKAMNKYN